MRRTRTTLAPLLILATLAISMLLLVTSGTSARAQSADTDGDGVPDSTETTYGSDPNSRRSTPEALGFDVATCSDDKDNDLDGATDSADSGCVIIIATATASPTPTPSPTPSPTATLPPITTATVIPTATTPAIIPATVTPTQSGVTSGGPGGDPTAPPPGGDFEAIDPTTKPGFGLPPFPDLRITDLELTQGIQDLENNMPLIDNRITYLRVYVATDEGNWFGVDAVVGAFRGGQQLGLTEDDNDAAVIFARNGTIVARESGGDRVNLDDSLYFRLPRHWTHGNTTLRVLVYGNGNPDSVDSEPDPDNNLRDLQATFEVGQDANVMLVPIHMHVGNTADGDLHSYTWQANEDQATNAVNDIFRLNPVSRLLVYGGELENQVFPLCHSGWCEFFPQLAELPEEWDLSDTTQVGQPNSRIKIYKDNTNPWVEGLAWYGMVFDDVTMTFQTPGFDPISISGLASSGVSYGKMDDGYWNSSPWHVSKGATLAHELAHNLGLSHVNCSGTEAAGGSVDGNYPYQNPDCSIADVDPAGYYGLDVYYKTWSWLTELAVISNDPDEDTPSRGFPLMGYQSPKWIDPYGYCLMLVGYGIDCDLDDLQIAVPNALREAFVATVAAIEAGQLSVGRDLAPSPTDRSVSAFQTADQFALVYGYIDHDANEAVIEYVQRIDDPLPHVIDEAIAREAQRAAAGPVDYVLTLRDLSGNIVGELPLVDFNVPNHAGPNAIQVFAELAIWPGDVGTIEVNDASGDLLVARPVSPSAPTVQITSPAAGDDVDAPLQLTWDATDPDGDQLVAMVQYSADGGATWRVVADTILGNGVEIASFGFMPAADGQGIFRVTVNDGVNTGRDEVANLTVPNGGPTPRILGPGNGHTALQGEIVSLDGTATDWEDGTVVGQSLTWSSDIDGDLGHGETFDTVSLSPGQHTITFAAEDSHGAVGEATIILTVRETLRPDRTAELRAAAARLGITLPDPPSDDSAVDVTSLGIGAAAGAVLMMILAVLVGRLRARRPT